MERRRQYKAWKEWFRILLGKAVVVGMSVGESREETTWRTGSGR
jgi:hypothetical protein